MLPKLGAHTTLRTKLTTKLGPHTILPVKGHLILKVGDHRIFFGLKKRLLGSDLRPASGLMLGRLSK